MGMNWTEHRIRIRPGTLQCAHIHRKWREIQLHKKTRILHGLLSLPVLPSPVIYYRGAFKDYFPGTRRNRHLVEATVTLAYTPILSLSLCRKKCVSGLCKCQQNKEGWETHVLLLRLERFFVCRFCKFHKCTHICTYTHTNAQTNTSTHANTQTPHLCECGNVVALWNIFHNNFGTHLTPAEVILPPQNTFTHIQINHTNEWLTWHTFEWVMHVKTSRHTEFIKRLQQSGAT